MGRPSRHAPTPPMWPLGCVQGHLAQCCPPPAPGLPAPPQHGPPHAAWRCTAVSPVAGVCPRASPWLCVSLLGVLHWPFHLAACSARTRACSVVGAERGATARQGTGLSISSRSPGEPSVWPTCSLFPELNRRMSGPHDAHTGHLPCQVGGPEQTSGISSAQAGLCGGHGSWTLQTSCFALSLSLSVCLRRLSAGRGEDAWVSFPGLVSTVGPGCARCPECPGGVHVIPLSQVMTCVLPRALHHAEL